MIRLDLDIRIESARRLFRNLSPSQRMPYNLTSQHRIITHQSLALLDMLAAEQKLAVEITQVNRIQIDDMNLAEARKHQIFKQFAADTARADHQHARLMF